MGLNPRDAVIVGAARTAIGRFGGTLSEIPAPRLGGYAIQAAVERAGINPADVEEVLMGNVVQAGEGQAPARQAALHAGLPDTVSATTVNKVCGSGLRAVMMAASMIRAGDGDVFVAGGMENMNMAPYLLPKARNGYRLGHGEILDSVIHDGLWCAVELHHMGNSAEWIAREYQVTRQAQDEFALRSHQRAATAQDAGHFKAEIVPIPVTVKRETIMFDTDEPVRRDTSLAALGKLKPAFDTQGSVTAGNAPGITDGASAIVVTSAEAAEARGLKPMARIVSYAQAGVKPLEIFSAPIFAVRKLIERMDVDLDHFDLVEMNEAFAAQVLADGNTLGVDWEKVNVNGGAIALGHPIGASGGRVLVTLLYALQARGLRTGLATLCLGGGEAVALAVEML